MGKMASKETMMVPMNAAPVITGDAAPNYAENGTGPVATYTGTDPEGVTVTWSLSGDDAEDFEISEDGMLTFKESPNFEAPADMDTDNVYMVTVEASDGTTDNVMQAVTVTVTNVDEPGMVTLWAGMVALTMPPQVGDTITGAVMDPDDTEMDSDDDVTVESWQWSRTMTPDMMASWMDIDGETNAAYPVMEGDTGYYLRVMATYTDAAGTDMHREYSPATMMVTAMMTAPMFDSETATREVAENTAADTGIGDPVTATDADSDTLTYALGGTDAASFGIDSSTGQLMTLAALDFETKPTYSVTVTASDSGGLSDSIDVTITVTDVDEDVAPPDPLVDKYDVNKDGVIERSEVFAAINDYLDEGAGAPTRADVFKLIELYLGD